MMRSPTLRRLLALLLAVLTAVPLTTESFALSAGEATEEVQAQENTEETGEAADEPEQQTDPEEQTAEQPETETEEPEVPAEGPEDEAEETPDAPDPSADTETEQNDPEPETPENGDDSAAEQEEQPQEEPAQEETPDAQTEAASDVPQYVLTVTSEASLTLTYDDRYSFTALAEDYAVLEIQTNKVTSYQVSGGDKTSQLDTAVLTLDGESETDVIASGVGTAIVWLVPKDQLEQGKAALTAVEALDTADAETAAASEITAASSPTTTPAEQTQPEGDGEAVEATEEDAMTEDTANEAPTGEAAAAQETTEEPIQEPTQVPAIQVEVTVKPAKLTLMLLAGQSNMEGSCGGSCARQNSVLCPEGEVYATYAPSNWSRGWAYAGISNYSDDADKMVAGSLTGTVSRDRTKLDYAPNALTKAGGGKTGPDSGLAYEWNRLTGDKVWVVNAAWCETGIDVWMQGGSAYVHAKEVFQAAIDTMEAEIAAGHYTQGNRLLFWLQGESNMYMAAGSYISKFTSFSSGMTADCGVEYFGLILPRSNRGEQTNEDDIYMNGTRTACYIMGGSTEYSRIYLVSNVNEKWVTDSGVRDYFRSAYSGGTLSYPLRSDSTLSGLPTTVAEVHPNIHYTQTAHNENGITAARNLFYIVKNKQPSSGITVTWRSLAGTSIDAFTLGQNNTATVLPVIEPLYYAKNVKVSAASSALTYAKTSALLTANSAGIAYLQVTDSAGKVISKLPVTVTMATPKLKSAEAYPGEVKVTWEKVSDVTGYVIYRKTNGSGWKQIGSVSSGSTVSYTDKNVVNGINYAYTVKAYRGTSFSGNDSSGISIYYLSVPTLTLGGSVGKVQLTWTQNSNADSYLLYRREYGKDWVKLGSVGSGKLTYTDTTAKADTRYDYCVRACKGGSKSGYIAVTWVDKLATPTLSGAKNAEGGIRVSWKAVTGANGFRVYRKTLGGSWTKIATVSGGTTLSYLDKSVKAGTKYTYTVRAALGSNLSGFSQGGCSATYLPTPVWKGLQNKANGIQVSWSAVSGADSYQIYRKTSGGSWSKLGTATGTSYTDTTAKSGTTYLYTLRAINKNTISGYHTAGYSICCLAAPKLGTLSNTNSGLKVTWGAVTGAASYQIYRKTGSGSWSKLGTATGTSYTDTTAKSGTTYSYTVRAVKGSTVSAYTGGKSLCRLSTPELTGVKVQTGKLAVSWKAVTGAASYQVYRKTGSGSWSRLGTVNGTSYTDKTVKAGTTYTYTVRAVKSGVLSDYNRTGKTAKAK